ncbi:hypothetical protein ACBZ90_07660 [Vibrio alginolyticus]
MSSIQQNIEHITSQIRYDEQKCGRTPESVQLLAVSKTKPVEAILEAYQAGPTAFGENYVQEGVSKVQHFAEHYPDNRIEWHFIGRFNPINRDLLLNISIGFTPSIEPRLLNA